MAIYALADLHLSFAQDKPMSKFGKAWENHAEKIKVNWFNTVKAEDTVLLCGDHSWALKLEEAVPDLEFIGQLPGRKILIKGNHDLWWQSLKKMKQVLPGSIEVVQNTFEVVEGKAICGSRGWICPNDDNFTAHDLKIYERELIRLENSLKAAKASGDREIIVMLHYPPFNNRQEPSGFVELMHRYGVQTCVYGHLHGEVQRSAVTGNIGGIEYHLVACDYVNFTPVLITAG
ncbi:metallophosphoesterase [Zhaonella formicivorans]|uniref:metallophosphoesterase n=1 Tax=Zhaonella formicivorans TaxID=2528593 RepID=UPI0010DACB3A|nr:metallophosphoesterase [Zhaonella formicivorans]